jgi:GT2 family glycosyltransferase
MNRCPAPGGLRYDGNVDSACESPERFTASHVSVVVINYNGLRILGACLASILRLDSAPAEIILIDDGSTDGSPAWVRDRFPAVRVVELGRNTKRLNRLRNRGIAESTSPLVLLVDNDVTLKSDCLDELLASLRTLPAAAVCMPRTLYDYDPTIIYQDGQVLHYVGSSLAVNRNLPLSRADDSPRVSIGWGVQLIDKSQAAAVGYFNEHYVMGWGDDGEFNYKMNLMGRFCYHVPSAVVYHKRTTGAQRYYGTVRNRWRFILECYEPRTLVLCAPALLAYEIALIVFLAAKGQIRQYLKAIAYVASHRRAILAERRAVQARRLVPDRKLMTGGSIFIASEYIHGPWLAAGYWIMNRVLNGYWVLVRPIL